MTVHAEQRVLQNKARYEWPERDPWTAEESFQADIFEYTNFQTDYINIIPKSWTVVSMTLSGSREELLICKMRANQPPLVLRLPLSRPNSMEDEDESFGFDEGKAELQDIIRLTNDSTRGSQDLSQKGAKTRWWEARTALDARLKDLLTNIENVWLGGFKGIFSGEAQNQDLLARLQQSLQKILDKHLPSRQKGGKGKQNDHLNFDHRVVELFVGLGRPSETHDIDEPLKDLLYFVVDILQFNGERNAYDEVDFDSVIPPLDLGCSHSMLMNFRSLLKLLMRSDSITRPCMTKTRVKRSGISFSFWTDIFIVSRGSPYLVSRARQ